MAGAPRTYDVLKYLGPPSLSEISNQLEHETEFKQSLFKVSLARQLVTSFVHDTKESLTYDIRIGYPTADVIGYLAWILDCK